MSREYAAFISYRHQPLDMKVADKVHEMIERYVIPKELRKDSKKHLGIAFRDQEELPLTSDLTGSIYEALDHSQFLVVICTPETPKSQWVAREIEYFINRHSRDRVLTVLAAGTMDESVPKAITTIYGEDGVTPIGQCEPLAAMIASSTHKQTMRLLKKEFPRLAAAMIGCPYDALIQRSKRRKMQLLTAALGVVAAVALSFTGMLLKKNAEVEEQLQQALINESKALAYQSQSVLEHGSRHEAIALAMSALPSEDNTRPYVAEAEVALVNALQVYHERNLRLDSQIVQNDLIYSISDRLMTQDGRYVLLVEGYDALCCYDSYTGERRWKQTGELFNGIWDIQLIYGETAVLMRTRISVAVIDLETGTLLRQSALSEEEVGPGNLLLAEQVWLQGGYYNIDTNQLQPRLFNNNKLENNSFCYKNNILFINEDFCYMKFDEEQIWHYLYVFDQHTGQKVAEIDFFDITNEGFDWIYYNARPNGTFHFYGFYYSGQEAPFISLVVTDHSGKILKKKTITPQIPYTEIIGCEYVGEKALFSAPGSMMIMDMETLSLKQIAMPEEPYLSGMDSDGNILAFTESHTAYYFPTGDYSKALAEYEIPINYSFHPEDRLDITGTCIYLEPEGNNVTANILRPVGGTDRSDLSRTGVYVAESSWPLREEAAQAFSVESDVSSYDIFAGMNRAVVFENGTIRVYDAQTKSVSTPLPVEFSKIEEGTATLIKNDTALAVLENSGSCIIVDLETGATLARYHLEAGEFRVYFYTDAEDRFLYICDTTAGGTGYRINMETWEIVAEIQGLRSFNTDDGLMFCSNSEEDDRYVPGQFYVPMELDDLIALGNEILSS